MASPTGSYLLVRDKRHSIRLRVPLDLVPRLGRAELVRALGTSDRRSARFVVAGVALRLRLFWAMVRKTPPLTPEELRRIADDWLRAALADQWKLLERGDFADAMAPAGLDAAERRAYSAYMFGLDADLTADRIVEGDYRRFDTDAGQLLSVAGHGERRGTQERAILSRLMLERFADLQRTKLAWAEGNVGSVPPQLISRTSMPTTTAARDHAGDGAEAAPCPKPASRSIAEAGEIFVASMRQRRIKEKHVIDVQSDLKLLVEAFGSERHVAEVTASDAGRLWEALRSLPPHFRRHPLLEGLGLFEKAEKARELGLRPLGYRTVNSYFRTLSNLFEQERKAAQVPSNPFHGTRERKPPRFVKQVKTFTATELEMLFASPLFQGAKSTAKPYDAGDHLVSDWRFWAPLIALMTGARIGEIAQLSPGDIRVEQGFAVLDINEAAGKTLKNAATARLIPLHDVLVELGLMRLAAERVAAKSLRLLPGMPVPIHGDPGKAPGQWMSERFLPRMKLKTRAGLGFHSFRHTLKTLLRNAQVPDSVSNNVCGHDKRTVGDDYGSIDLAAMKSGLIAIKLPDSLLRLGPRHVD
ncbi:MULTISPECIES: site-specific integrase [Roseomonadaceae]|uniref:Site-specific integrase n=1 Tax=Falsiroseomonas oleicola TaxID=2801474 RepID=A0ABS6H409_9PROT|nr:site-specific integrase [Roseomonas oleicola]MBU8543408.1 site-specific integrase [Roseomonas oleicola]